MTDCRHWGNGLCLLMTGKTRQGGGYRCILYSHILTTNYMQGVQTKMIKLLSIIFEPAILDQPILARWTKYTSFCLQSMFNKSRIDCDTIISLCYIRLNYCCPIFNIYSRNYEMTIWHILMECNSMHITCLILYARENLCVNGVIMRKFL